MCISLLSLLDVSVWWHGFHHVPWQFSAWTELPLVHNRADLEPDQGAASGTVVVSRSTGLLLRASTAISPPKSLGCVLLGFPIWARLPLDHGRAKLEAGHGTASGISTGPELVCLLQGVLMVIAAGGPGREDCLQAVVEQSWSCVMGPLQGPQLGLRLVGLLPLAMMRIALPGCLDRSGQRQDHRQVRLELSSQSDRAASGP